MANKERGRPTVNKLPPRIEATPEEIAQVLLRASSDREWKYLEAGGADYKCGECGRSVHYPETLYEDGRCVNCQ